MPIGDHLRDVQDFYGHPGCHNTNACLIAAGEKGVDINAHVVSDWGAGSEIRSMTPLGIGPVLKDRACTNYGIIACLSYIDDKGFGPSLVHRNGVTRARMWREVSVAAQTDCSDDASLAASLDQLEETLGSSLGNMRGDYVCGQYTLADCAWAGVCQVANNNGKGNAVSSRARVNKWFGAVQSHPSTSKESINPFSCMCTKADADGGTIRNIAINAG
ncbi:MAG: glutathione S-transferase family protein [Pseudomonadota bacterium]|nr:glutathione S-transferase family protein [Pseudomonadota bacterium]